MLTLLQKFGVLPDLSGASAPAAPHPIDAPGGVNGPPAQTGPDTRSFLERFYKPGPGLLDSGGSASGAKTSTQPVDPSNAGAARGIRNNNPLNLGYVPGQAGLVAGTPSDGRFGRYQTMADGVAAAERQLMRYQVRDHLNTVRQMVSKWAPPGENDTNSYVQQVAKAMGVDADAPVSLNNQATAASMIGAMAKRETGRSIDTDTLSRGVAMGLGQQGAQGAPMQLASSGAGSDAAAPAKIQLQLDGRLDKGLSMTVTGAQGATVSGPLVERPQLLGAHP